ncbi:MAG: maleylacetoacetate isomerase [Legionellaceae bacterium]|nr:maleylacetoacetate isomerase [Legionellaceae bacterium]
MKLYDYYRSSCSYRVRIALNIKKINYETIPIHLVQDGGIQHSLAYQAVNPQELVPSLETNNHILTQSLAIIEYLEEMNPEPAFLPTHPLERAQIRGLAQLIACDIHPLNNLRVLKTLREEFKASDDQITAWYHQWLQTGFNALETKLATLPRTKSVCFKDQVSLADICLIPQVYNATRFEFSLDNYPLIQEINAYCLTIPEFSEAAPST